MLASASDVQLHAPRRRSAPSTSAASLALPATARAIAAIDLPDVVPASLAGVCEPIFDRLRPGDLLVDETYQRGLSPKSLRLIRRIVEGWDWLKFKAPTVALTDLGFEVVDGQHTAIAAACHPGVETIPVMVIDGSDMQRRARAFVSHAVDRLQVRPVEVWHAAVAAGDEDATTIRNVLDRAGVTLLPNNPAHNTFNPRETIALGAVRRLINRRGAMRAREVLEILARADLAPILADHVRIAEALLLEETYAGGLDAERITAAVRDLSPKQNAEAKELAFAKRMPLWRALAAVLYRAHVPPKRGRAKTAEAAPAEAGVAEPAPVPTRAPAPKGPVEMAHIRGVGDVPAVALAAGVARWRRGEPWSPVWGPAPGEPECGVPGAFLGKVALIVGFDRWEAVIARTLSLWRRDGQWPAAGWGPSPADPNCAVPTRFRDAVEPV